jgi:acyl-CoA reductase-like NAD-dependent aldehyde dehydrogenase
MLTRPRLEEFFPHSPHPRSFLKNEITADIHTERDFKRHSEALAQAEKDGDLLYRAEANSATRRMGISLVRQHETSTGPLVENEIFGPVLPIIAVKVRSYQNFRQCRLTP